MQELIERQLWSYISSIEPTQNQKDDARKSHLYLRELLSTGQIGNRINDSFLSGSYVRDTAIRPIDDVDILFLINPNMWEKSFLEDYPSPASVLQTFSNAIRYRYPLSSVYGQRRSVRLSLYHLDIDVVPAINVGQGFVLIADSSTDRWIKSAPALHAQKATDVNKARGNRFKPLVKLLKYWNGNIPESARFKSFCIETLAARIFSEVDFQSIDAGLLYFWDFSSRFGQNSQIFTWPSNYGVTNSILFGLNVPDLAGTGSNIASGITSDHQYKFSDYAARSRDRLLSARKALNSTTMLSHLRDALYIG